MQHNVLMNQVLVETSMGNKAFNLILGDILQDDGQLIILNIYEEDGQLVGDFAPQFATYQQQERVISYLQDGGKITFVDGPTRFLLIYIQHKEQEPIEEASYQSYVQAIFSSLLRLEMEGYRFETVALPVLFRKAIEAIHARAVQILVEQAERWLAKSLVTTSIRYYIYVPADMERWSHTLNSVLGRTFIDISEAGDVQHIRRQLLAEMERFSQQHPIYLDTLVPLKRSLERPQLTMEVIAAFARKLAESLCEELVGQPGNSFDLNIYQLRQQRSHSPVFIQRLYLVKSFGNSAVHRPAVANEQLTAELEDIQILLLIIVQLIQDFPQEVLLSKDGTRND